MNPFHCTQRWRIVPMVVGAIVAIFFGSATVLSAQKILFIGHLNPDCYADTVIGTRHGNELTYLPDAIVWGQPDSLSAPCGADSSSKSKKKAFPHRTTKITYPGYHNMAGSVSFVQFNPNDTLMDMMLFLWGTKRAEASDADTGRVIVVFGQKDLEQRPVLAIHQIKRGFQNNPFFAQDLTVGDDLHSPKKRDLSGIVSYAIRRPSVVVGDTAEPPPPIVTAVRDSVALHVYPNPSLYTTTIEAQVEAGAYTAQVVGVDGRVQREQEVRLEQRGLLWHNVDVSTLPNGYYVVQLRRDGVVVGSYPFIIMR